MKRILTFYLPLTTLLIDLPLAGVGLSIVILALTLLFLIQIITGSNGLTVNPPEQNP